MFQHLLSCQPGIGLLPAISVDSNKKKKRIKKEEKDYKRKVKWTFEFKYFSMKVKGQ